jgi:hypothetical protein
MRWACRRWSMAATCSIHAGQQSKRSEPGEEADFVAAGIVRHAAHGAGHDGLLVRPGARRLASPDVGKALFFSFIACWMNWRPFMVYGSPACS